MAHTPRDRDWDRFWKRGQSEKFTKASWSKKRIIQVLEPLATAEKTALDAGCGSGFFSRYFCDQGMTTFALDFSPEALEWTRKATVGRAQTFQVDLLSENLPEILPGRTDLIFTDGLFEHFSLQDQDRIMSNLASVLADDGYLVTFVPNRWSPWELIRPFFMPGIEEKPFTMNGLLDLNLRNGLKVIESGGVNTLPFRFSPEGNPARIFGMLLYTVSEKGSLNQDA